ncbi:metal-dependent hydrolase [Actinophytocola sp.]|uniref:metal-dependent hydrolase n=1 Tax=Actinophytocola sp. TaxID=1872138 RepID=UPI002ED2D992
MMGVTHSATGMLAGLVLGRGIGLESMTDVAPFAATCAGYALLPDLDHPHSTVTRKLGPITRVVSAGLRASSGALYRATKGPRDENVKGTHRHASHTAVFAALLGAFCWASTTWWGVWAVVAWLGFGLLLAYDRLGMLIVVPLGIGAAGWLVQAGSVAGIGPAANVALEQCSGWLGIAVAVGMFVHCLGDAMTESGCPFLFPIPIAGETWYELRPPALLRFRTGKWGEYLVVLPLVVVACVAALPGVWPQLMTAVNASELFGLGGSQ